MLSHVFIDGSDFNQNPKGGGIDSTLGGSANQMFGAAKSTDFVEKSDLGLAATLFILCVFDSYCCKIHIQGGSLIQPLQ